MADTPSQSPPSVFLAHHQKRKPRDCCVQCGRAKLRCTRERPSCARCKAKGLECTYGLGKPVGRPRKHTGDSRRECSPRELRSLALVGESEDSKSRSSTEELRLAIPSLTLSTPRTEASDVSSELGEYIDDVGAAYEFNTNMFPTSSNGTFTSEISEFLNDCGTNHDWGHFTTFNLPSETVHLPPNQDNLTGQCLCPLAVTSIFSYRRNIRNTAAWYTTGNCSELGNLLSRAWANYMDCATCAGDEIMRGVLASLADELHLVSASIGQPCGLTLH